MEQRPLLQAQPLRAARVGRIQTGEVQYCAVVCRQVHRVEHLITNAGSGPQRRTTGLRKRHSEQQRPHHEPRAGELQTQLTRDYARRHGHIECQPIHPRRERLTGSGLTTSPSRRGIECRAILSSTCSPIRSVAAGQRGTQTADAAYMGANRPLTARRQFVLALTYDQGMSNQLDASTAVPIPDATTMKRLAYIRLMHQQAVTQSYGPVPLNSSAVLTFHDVCEFLFIVAVEHVGTGQEISLRETFLTNINKKFRGPDGRLMSSRDAVERLAGYRDAFKHRGAIPGPDQLESARRDATRFLESNCPRFFGLEFADISMLHIVPQQEVRDHLKAARQLAETDNIAGAMGELALAFDQLLTDWGRGKRLRGSAFLSAPFDLTRTYRTDRRLDFYPTPSDQGLRQTMSSLASSVKQEFKNVDTELETIRDLLRIQMAGVDMAGYLRFAMIAPEVSKSMGGGRTPLDMEGQLHYTPANYDSCELFVVDSALRMAQSDFKLWMPQTFGDWNRAKEAMAANGGRLPEDMS